jgi:hypothetical protein
MINNTKTSFWVAIIMTVTLIQSCSVQQRRYTGGLSIQWPSFGKSQQKSTKGSLHSKVNNEQAAHHPFTQPQAPIEKQENHRQEIGVNNHPFLKPFSSNSAAETLSKQTECEEHFTEKKPSSAGLSKGLVQMKSTSHKSGKKGHHGNSLSNDPGGDLITIIGVILGLLGIFFGSDSSSGGGWGGGGGRGGYFDWTAFWAISSVVIAAGGVIAAIALRGAVKPGIYAGILLIPFTALGLPAGIIGLIKSIRDYYDVGKYLSIAALSLLGVMWIIALVSL